MFEITDRTLTNYNWACVVHNLIIVPICFSRQDNLGDVSAHYRAKFSNGMNSATRVVIAINYWNQSDEIKIISYEYPLFIARVSVCESSNINRKLATVGLLQSTFRAANIMLFDDDARPDIALIQAMSDELQSKDTVRAMVSYDDPSEYDKIDLSSVLALSVLSRRKQYWGCIAIKKSMIPSMGIFYKDVLFDELYLDNICCASEGGRAYLFSPLLKMKRSSPTFFQWLHQRIRYAYEDFGNWPKALLTISLLPSIAFIWIFVSYIYAMAGLILVTIFLLIAARLGAVRADLPQSCRRAWFRAPVWYFTSTLAIWFSVFVFLARRGVEFGGRRMRRPA